VSSFVLDATVTMAWCFADEATPLSEAILDRLSRLTDTAHLEFAIRQRLPVASFDQALAGAARAAGVGVIDR